ncbi:MAG TPA: phosphoribosylglycinamide synthetase C domain-containing protein [Beijerinckiaceae bacterium]|jgi:phosphoribosylamine--glycine ligase|nr:phosphoribosylglycinamide synthetase C domain-containing protein [Beijerinckiaceae bacterium]
MRFLAIGDTCDMASMYVRLTEQGHEVRIFVSEPGCHDVLAGMVARIPDWRQELDWVREAGDDGIILFENVSYDRGQLQEALRRDGFQVVGGSAYGDRLENDRAFAQKTLSQLGFPICRTHEFDSAESGQDFISENPGRYVLKFNGHGFASADNYVGGMEDGRDVKAVIAARFKHFDGTEASYVLMQHMSGIEMGVGAYFDGEKFLTPACLDWEHKRFFPGDLGELTGEMGTVVTYSGTSAFFDKTLRRMEPLLKQNGYCGYINLNTIVNQDGIWPLEFTCRFGCPGYAILEPLQETQWADLFKMMVTRSARAFATRPGYCVGVVLTTRPFPYNRKRVPSEPAGLPILFDGEISEDDRRHLHLAEVGKQDGELVTAGMHGWTMIVTGIAATVGAARDAAYALADRVVIPNVRYRRDIGAKLETQELARLNELGFYGGAG